MMLAFALAAGLTLWDKSRDGDPKTYRMDGYTLTFTSQKAEERYMSVAILTVTAPGAAKGVLKAEPGYETTLTYFGVADIDPKTPGAEILISTYTGGAHCCGSIKLLERAGRGWRAVDLGRWDGDPLEKMPDDVDGDGTRDFVLNDNSFLYTFGPYSGSWPPPQILNVVSGKAVDVSTAPRYRKLFVDEMARAKVECARHQNGGCSGYVADAARAGLFAEAWRFMLANYDKRPARDYPARCRGTMVDFECKGTEIKPRDFPEALAWFLKDHGYTR